MTSSVVTCVCACAFLWFGYRATSKRKVHLTLFHQFYDVWQRLPAALAFAALTLITASARAARHGGVYFGNSAVFLRGKPCVTADPPILGDVPQPPLGVSTAASLLAVRSMVVCAARVAVAVPPRDVAGFVCREVRARIGDSVELTKAGLCCDIDGPAATTAHRCRENAVGFRVVSLLGNGPPAKRIVLVACMKCTYRWAWAWACTRHVAYSVLTAVLCCVSQYGHKGSWSMRG